MALQLKLDVVRDGELIWNRSPVLVPEDLRVHVRGLTTGTVVEAQCAWGAGGLSLLAAPVVVETALGFEKRLAVAVERSNWESVLELVAVEAPTAQTAAWRARALLHLGREPEFEQAFAELIAHEQVDLSDAPTGLWRIRRDIDAERWLRLPRRLRAGAFKLAWRGLISAKDFGGQPFAQTLEHELARLLEAVEPRARPAQLHAGGPALERSPESLEVIAWCTRHLEPFATQPERADLAPVFALLSDGLPADRKPLRAHKRRAGAEPTVANAVAQGISAMTNLRPNAAVQRALAAVGAVLARAPADEVKSYLTKIDQLLLVHESRALVPRASHQLRSKISAVHYRGSVELRIGELDAIVGQATESWFALRRHEDGWLCVEGSRDDALAAIPDELFEEAVASVMGQA